MEDTNHQNHTHDKEGNTAGVNPVYMQPQSNLWKSEQLPYCSQSSGTGGWETSSWHLERDGSSLTFMETKDREVQLHCRAGAALRAGTRHRILSPWEPSRAEPCRQHHVCQALGMLCWG